MFWQLCGRWWLPTKVFCELLGERRATSRAVDCDKDNFELRCLTNDMPKEVGQFEDDCATRRVDQSKGHSNEARQSDREPTNRRATSQNVPECLRRARIRRHHRWHNDTRLCLRLLERASKQRAAWCHGLRKRHKHLELHSTIRLEAFEQLELEPC